MAIRCKMRASRRARAHRGFTLIETLLALGVGAVVMVSSVAGLQRYTEGVRVEAAAGTLQRLAQAADEWAAANYDTLLAQAPRNYDISVLRGYFSHDVSTASLQDAFRHEYRIATRKYGYGAGTEALQVLVVGEPTTDTSVADRQLLRADIANATGAGAGFIATSDVGCQGAAQGDICGAFGSYSIPVADFGAGAGPAIDWGNATVVALVNKGDIAAHGEQLYRYDIGDDELNTMHTDLHMAGNSITEVGTLEGDTVAVTTVDAGTVNASTRVDTPALGNTHTIDMTNVPSGATSLIRNTHGAMTIEARDDIAIDADSVTVALADGGDMRVGSNASHSLVVGAYRSHTIDSQTERTGTGNLYAGTTWSEAIRTRSISSLTAQKNDPLRLQPGVAGGGEVMVGDGMIFEAPDGTQYDLSDGVLKAGHLMADEVTCVQCGGNLVDVLKDLPKWRHVDRHHFQDSSHPISATVPAPSCGAGLEPRIVALGWVTTWNQVQRGSEGDYETVIKSEFTSAFTIALDPSGTHWTIGRPAYNTIEVSGWANTYCVAT